MEIEHVQIYLSDGESWRATQDEDGDWRAQHGSDSQREYVFGRTFDELLLQILDKSME